MSFLNTFDIAASGLTAQRFRIDMIAQNMTNINTTRTAEGGPYQRRQVVFQERQLNFRNQLERAAARMSGNNTGGGVRVTQVVRDDSDFIPVYDPAHPDADEAGYVMMPNVDMTKETVDLMAATHSYNANISALEVIKSMAMKAAEITR